MPLASFPRRRAIAALALFPWITACSGDDKDDRDEPSEASRDRDELGRSYGPERLSSPRLDPSLVRLVARGNGTPNLLMRGNAPLENGRFAYDGLVAALRAAAGSDWPERFRIVDVCLMNEIVEADEVDVERRYWEAHPDRGRFIHHPIFGALTDPADYPSALRRTVERWSGLDRMDDLLRELDSMLNTAASDGVAQVLFVHCRAGRDRTGQTIASYDMRYQGRSYREAISNAEQVAGRSLVRFSRYGTAWYAHKLADRLSLPTIGPIP